MNKLTYILFFLLGMFTLSAQESASTSSASFDQATSIVKEPEMADAFRSDGKIYVVIAVISITFLCLIGYLIYIDIKLRKLENSKKN